FRDPSGRRRRTRFRASARCRRRGVESDQGQVALEYRRISILTAVGALLTGGGDVLCRGWVTGKLSATEPRRLGGGWVLINAAIGGWGWWGKTLVESATNSDAIRFVAGATRTVTPEVEAFAKKHGFRPLANYDAALADRDIDAVVLATPHSMHGAQVVAAA